MKMMLEVPEGQMFKVKFSCIVGAERDLWGVMYDVKDFITDHVAVGDLNKILMGILIGPDQKVEVEIPETIKVEVEAVAPEKPTTIIRDDDRR